jgi:hypothetical protein
MYETGTKAGVQGTAGPAGAGWRDDTADPAAANQAVAHPAADSGCGAGAGAGEASRRIVWLSCKGGAGLQRAPGAGRGGAGQADAVQARLN